MFKTDDNSWGKPPLEGLSGKRIPFSGGVCAEWDETRGDSAMAGLHPVGGSDSNDTKMSF